MHKVTLDITRQLITRQLTRIYPLCRLRGPTTGSLIPGVRGGLINVTIRYTVYMCHGAPIQMHGNGQHVLTNLVGKFPVERVTVLS